MKENTNLRANAVVQHALQHALRVAALASAVYQIETYTHYENRFKCLTKRDLGLFLVSCCTTTTAQKRAPQRAARVAPPRQHSTSECCCGGATRTARCGNCFCGCQKRPEYEMKVKYDEKRPICDAKRTIYGIKWDIDMWWKETYVRWKESYMLDGKDLYMGIKKTWMCDGKRPRYPMKWDLDI